MSEGADHLRELARQLKDADKTLRKELTASLRRDVKPVTQDVQATVRSSTPRGPGRGSRGTRAAGQRAAHTLSRSRSQRPSAAASAEKRSGLRESIARATGASVSTAAESGVNAVWRVRTSRMPEGQRKLPRYWNKGSWRHPVFGNKKVWVTQQGKPYFDRVIVTHREDLQKSVIAAMEETAKKITEAA